MRAEYLWDTGLGPLERGGGDEVGWALAPKLLLGIFPVQEEPKEGLELVVAFEEQLRSLGGLDGLFELLQPILGHAESQMRPKGTYDLGGAGLRPLGLGVATENAISACVSEQTQGVLLLASSLVRPGVAPWRNATGLGSG